MIEVEDFYVLLISLTLSAPQISVFSHWIQLGNFLVRIFCHISLVLNLIIAFFSFLHLVSKGSLYDYGLVWSFYLFHGLYTRICFTSGALQILVFSCVWYACNWLFERGWMISYQVLGFCCSFEYWPISTPSVQNLCHLILLFFLFFWNVSSVILKTVIQA